MAAEIENQKEIVGAPYTLIKKVLVCFHQRVFLSEIYRLAHIQETVYEEDNTENMILTIKTNAKNYARIKKYLDDTRNPESAKQTE
jgi:hypothetical protein